MNRAQRNRAARLARRVEIDGRLVAPLPEEKHGLLSSYSNHGCRCDGCTEANTDRWRGYYQTYLSTDGKRQRAQLLRQDGGAAA